MLYIIVFMVFITVFVLIYGILISSSQEKRLVNRLYKYMDIEHSETAERKKNARGITRSILSSGKKLGELGVFDGYRRNVQIQLTKAHVPLKGEEFITICISTSLGFAFILGVILKNPLGGLVCGILGWFIPGLFLKLRKKKRTRIFNDQLGDAIALISNSIKAGYSFFQAVETVSTEMSGSIAEEFSHVKKEINLGITTEHALENLVKRVESDDLELVVTAVLIQRQVGGNLAEILDNISDTIRERIRIKGEVKAVTAQGRMSGLIIGILPPGMAVVIYLINPEHIKLLFNNRLGLIMVGASIIMEIIGILVIKKIVNIEV